MEKKNSSINLAGSQKNDLFERVINWTLTVGRTLIIITELIALLAFLYRFGLDAQIIDLHTKIKSDQEVISFLKKNEDAYRNLQDRLAIAASFSKIQTQKLTDFKNIIALTPVGITFSTFTISDKTLKVVADANSITSLSSFIQSLKTYPSVTGVSIDTIQNRTTTATINVSITVNLKQ